MATKAWKIEKFLGINQNLEGSLCNEGTSPDAYNMDTSDGNLCVAKGYVKHIAVPVPGTGPVKRLRIMKIMNSLIFMVLAKDEDGCFNLYAYDPSGEEWKSIYVYPSEVKGNHWDFLQCNIGNYDYVLIACGEHQMVKWDGEHANGEHFGSGEKLITGKVKAYADKVITLEEPFSESNGIFIKVKGVIIGETTYEVEETDYENSTIKLKEAPSPAPVAGSDIEVKGGLSDAKVNYLALHFSRLFAAGDSENPNRLYYSQIAGDGRSIEDWSADPSSPNTGGGFIEIGDSVGDPIIGLVGLTTQLLIVKRYSIYRLLGDRPSNFTVERVDNVSERMNHTSIVTHKDMALYFTPLGICYFNNVTVQPLPDAKSIRRFMDGCYVSMSKGLATRDKLYFTCYKGPNPDTREYDNHIVEYDLDSRCYMIRNGFEVGDIVALDGTIYMINGERFVYRFNEGDDYDGRPIAAHWSTQCTDWRARSIDKKVDELYIRGEKQGDAGDGSVVLVTTRYGAGLKVYRALLLDDPCNVMEIRPESDWARTFQFCFDNEAGSRFTIYAGLEVYIQAKERAK